MTIIISSHRLHQPSQHPLGEPRGVGAAAAATIIADGQLSSSSKPGESTIRTMNKPDFSRGNVFGHKPGLYGVNKLLWLGL